MGRGRQGLGRLDRLIDRAGLAAEGADGGICEPGPADLLRSHLRGAAAVTCRRIYRCRRCRLLSPPGLRLARRAFHAASAPPARSNGRPSRSPSSTASRPAPATTSSLRMFQEALEKDLGHPAGVRIQARRRRQRRLRVRRQGAPDGYTLLIGTAGTHGINAALYKKLPFDVEADFTPIAPLADVPNVLAVNPTVIDAKTVKDFIAAVKAAPGKFNYGSTGNGASTHLGFAQFNAVAGLDMVHVPYKGSPEAHPGHGDGRGLLHVRAGADRARAVAGRQGAAARRQHQGAGRHPAPTCRPSTRPALPGFENVTWYGLIAPKGLDPKIAERINAAGAQGPGEALPCARSSPASARPRAARRSSSSAPPSRPTGPSGPRSSRPRAPRSTEPARRTPACRTRGRRGGPRPAPRADLVVRPPVRRARRRHPVGRRRLLAGRAEPHRSRLRAAPARHPARRASACSWSYAPGGRARPVDTTIAWRPLVLICGAVVAFALVFEASGLVPAILVSVCIANYATPENRWTTAVVLGGGPRLLRLAAVREGPVAAAARLVEVSGTWAISHRT